MDDGELVALVLEEPELGIDLELEAVRRLGGVAAPLVAVGDAVAQDEQAAALVRQLPPRVLGERLAHGRRHYHHSLLLVDLLALPEVGGEVLPAAVGEHADDDALLELAREPAGDVQDGAARDAGEDALALEERVHARDRLLVRDEQLPVELRDVEDRRHVAVVERAQAHHRVARQRLGRGDDDVGEALAQPRAGAHQRPAGAEAGDEDVDAVERVAISAPVPS